MTDDDAPPLREFRVDPATLNGDRLTIGDLIDICEAAEVAPDDLLPMLNDPRQGTRRLRAMAALAWIVNRKTEPKLTMADVLANRIVIGPPPEAAADAPADPT